MNKMKTMKTKAEKKYMIKINKYNFKTIKYKINKFIIIIIKIT